MSFPGNSKIMGFWPGAWTMGNLGRPGYGATNHGVWPYTYNECAFLTSWRRAKGAGRLTLAAQATSARFRTKPGQMAPIPSRPGRPATQAMVARCRGCLVSVCRPARALAKITPDRATVLVEARLRVSSCVARRPAEDNTNALVAALARCLAVDINEMQVDLSGVGSTSQSIQFAPIDAGYLWKNETPETTMFNTSITFQSESAPTPGERAWRGADCSHTRLPADIWHGSVNQESASVITLTDDTSYEGAGYTSFGFEYEPGSDGRITWAVNATPSWELSAAAMGPNADAQIGQRLVSEEPMSIILNLAISEKFQPPEWGKMTFPGTLRFDYVRVYQKGTPKVTCDPDDYREFERGRRVTFCSRHGD